jgi:hypothetical protein
MFSVLFPLFNSLFTQVFKGVTCKGGSDESFFASEGVVAARITAGFGGEEKSSLFPLHAFIPLLKCSGLCLDARCSYPSTIFFCYLWTSSFMFAT